MNKQQLVESAGTFLIVSNMTDPNSIRELKLVRVTNDCFVGTDELSVLQDRHNPNQKFLKEFCWPTQVRDQLVEVITERQRLQKALDESMSLVYELTNKIASGKFE